jgi:chromosome segregation ATPase
VADISSDLSSMRAYIEGMNGSIAVELSGLEVRLGADIAALDIALEAVNASIQSELLGLGDDIAAFRTEMTGDLAAIMARLDRNNQTQNENYNRLQSLVNDINSTSLADIKNQLAALKSDSDLKETGLNAKLDDFKNKTLTRLENLTGLMTMLDDIRSLTSDVKNLQTQVNGVKDQQTSTKKQVEALAPPSWGSMVLVIMVLALSIVLLLMSRGKKHEPVRP